MGFHGGVEIRAFRGSRRSAVYRECFLPATIVARIRAAAARHRLDAFRVLDRVGDEVPKEAARRVADGATALRLTGELADLDDELNELADVAHWVSRAPRRAWLTVRRQ